MTGVNLNEAIKARPSAGSSLRLDEFQKLIKLPDSDKEKASLSREKSFSPALVVKSSLFSADAIPHLFEKAQERVRQALGAGNSIADPRYLLSQGIGFASGVGQAAVSAAAYLAQTAGDATDVFAYRKRTDQQQRAHEQSGASNFGRIAEIPQGIAHLGKVIAAGSPQERRALYEGIKAQAAPYLTKDNIGRGLGIFAFNVLTFGGGGAAVTGGGGLGVMQLNRMRKAAKLTKHAGESANRLDDALGLAAKAAHGADDMARIAQPLSPAGRILDRLQGFAAAAAREPLEILRAGRQSIRSIMAGARGFYHDSRIMAQRLMNGDGREMFENMATPGNAYTWRAWLKKADEGGAVINDAAATGRGGLRNFLNGLHNKLMKKGRRWDPRVQRNFNFASRNASESARTLEQFIDLIKETEVYRDANEIIRSLEIERSKRTMKGLFAFSKKYSRYQSLHKDFQAFLKFEAVPQHIQNLLVPISKSILDLHNKENFITDLASESMNCVATADLLIDGVKEIKSSLDEAILMMRGGKRSTKPSDPLVAVKNREASSAFISSLSIEDAELMKIERVVDLIGRNRETSLRVLSSGQPVRDIKIDNPKKLWADIEIIMQRRSQAARKESFAPSTYKTYPEIEPLEQLKNAHAYIVNGVYDSIPANKAAIPDLKHLLRNIPGGEIQKIESLQEAVLQGHVPSVTYIKYIENKAQVAFADIETRAKDLIITSLKQLKRDDNSLNVLRGKIQYVYETARAETQFYNPFLINSHLKERSRLLTWYANILEETISRLKTADGQAQIEIIADCLRRLGKRNN